MRKLNFLSLLVAAALAGCAQTRKPSLSDDVKDQTFAITEFTGADGKLEFTVPTTGKPSALKPGQKLRAIHEKGSTPVDAAASTLPPKMRFLVEGYEAHGTPASIRVTFKVSASFVTAYQVVTDASSLSIIDRALVAPAAGDDARLLLPIFRFKVESFGVVERKKNELKEPTSLLVLTKTHFDQAKDIQVNNDPAGREVTLPELKDGADDLEQIFLAAELAGRGLAMTSAEVRDQMNILTGLKDDEHVGLTLDGAQLNIYSLSSGTPTLASHVPAVPVKPRMTTSAIDGSTGKLALDPATAADGAGLVKIVKGLAVPETAAAKGAGQ